MIIRTLEKTILDLLRPGKAIILYGARQVGKTTLTKKIISEINSETRYINCDELLYQEVLSQRSLQVLGDLVGISKVLAIDEAQRVQNIGLSLKLIIDNYPDTALIVIGSASLELSKRTSEPLTGRKVTLTLYPLSFGEMKRHIGPFETNAQLENYLIYGSYPEIVLMKSPRDKQRYLDELVGSYLYKDILELEGLKRADKIVDLLRLVAFQIGQEVSLSELGTRLGLNKKTIENYLDLLEKSFVIYRLSGFSRNLRKEITKNSRYYFFDNGVRNALIRNFNPLNIRDDVGQLWENYIVTERAKTLQREDIQRNRYFWRTYDQKEIDLIEEGEGRLTGYEIKYNPRKISKATKQEFLKAYPEAELIVIDRENFDDYIG